MLYVVYYNNLLSPTEYPWALRHMYIRMDGQKDRRTVRWPDFTGRLTDGRTIQSLAIKKVTFKLNLQPYHYF